MAEVQPSGASRKMDLKPLEGLGHVAAAGGPQLPAERRAQLAQPLASVSPKRVTSYNLRCSYNKSQHEFYLQATLCSLTNNR